LQSSKVIGECGSKYLVNRNTMSFGDDASLFVKVLWNIYNHAHPDLLRIPRTSAGPFTEMPNCLAPSKSLLLCVTIIAPHWTANSRIRSSSGSCKLGRLAFDSVKQETVMTFVLDKKMKLQKSDA
jgi:hypothetical protein